MISAPLKNAFAFVLLAVVAAVTYSNALRSDFFMDDAWLFDHDRTAYVQAKIQSVFFNQPLAEQWRGYQFNISYRPLSQLIPLANHLVFQNNAAGYHIVSLILFIICVIMIFVFLKFISRNSFISLTAALLFAVHPINNLMINYVSAQTFSVQLLLMITSSMFFLRYDNNPKNILPAVISLLAFYLAALCHESTLALPLFLTALSSTVPGNTLKKTAKTLWPFYGLSLILGALWISKTSAFAQGPDPAPWFIYPAGLAHLQAWYLGKLLFPDGVLIMYVIPVKKISVLYGWSALACAAALLIATRRLWTKNTFMIWALSWFGIGCLLTAAGGTFQPDYGITIAPHWLYFSSLGLFLIAAHGLDASKKYHARLPVILAALLVAVLGCSTFRLNSLWTDQFLYAQYWAEHNPDFLKTRLILGDMHFNRGEYREAEQQYLSVVGQGLTDDKYLSQLGRIGEIEGRLEDAAGYYEQALEINPNNPKTLNNLAIIRIKTGKPDQAEQLLLKAVAINPGMLPLRINLAIAYEQQGRIDEALRLLQKNLEMTPNDSQTLSAITRLMLKQAEKP